MKAPSSLVPVVLLSGFLGAGKTTYLNQMLRHTPLDTAVVENELGAQGLDVDMLDQLRSGSSRCSTAAPAARSGPPYTTA